MTQLVTNAVPADVSKLADDRVYDLQLKDFELRRRAVELPVELAKLGLRGTLIGAMAGFLLLVALALITAFSDRVKIDGWHLCVLAGIVGTTVAVFGSFVFQRSFSVAAQVGDKIARVMSGRDAEPGAGQGGR